MPTFRFNITDPSGGWRSGNITGETRDEVSASLTAQGMTIESLEEIHDETEAHSSRATRQEAAEFVEQLAALTRSGLPLPAGLRAAALELRSPRLKWVFREMAGRIERGDPVEAAVADLDVQFPPHIRGLLLAGARSGRLAEVLGEYVRRTSLGIELRRQFWATLAYPLTGLGLIALLVWFICTVSVTAIQSMADSLKGFGQTRPSMVEAMISIARGIAEYGPGFALTLLVLGIAGWIGLRMAVGAAARRRLACSIPGVGPMLRFTAMTEFCHLMAMLLEAELPMPRALDLAGESVNDADLAESCGRMARAVESGEPLSIAVDQWPGIPAGLGQLFRWSESQQRLPASLRLVGDIFEARARSQGSFASSFLAIVVFLLILWGIGFAIAALYLPMFQLIQLIRLLAGMIWL